MSTLYSLPTELIFHIFTFLPAKDLTNCRRICQRFKQIVDGLEQSDTLWKKHCKYDYPDVYLTAYFKCPKIGMLWYHVYRSLSLWPHLGSATEVQDEFSMASCINEEINDIVVLRDGIIGVHKYGKIDYYDIETLEKSKRGSITGNYLKYMENDNFIVILNYHFHLFVIHKFLKGPHSENDVTFDDVKNFILVNREVYYMNLTNEVYVCKIENGNIKNKLLKRLDTSIMCLGFTDKLHILTFERSVYTVDGNKFEYTRSLEADMNLMHQLHRYRFLEHIHWRVYFEWMFMFKHHIPNGPLKDIIMVRTYGDVYFVGTNWGVLRIYYAPYSSGELDLFNAQPIKQYNFMERPDCPVLATCSIKNVDVIETEDGHTVVVAMPKKIAVLYFTHNFKYTVSITMLPSSDIIKEDLESTKETIEQAA